MTVSEFAIQMYHADIVKDKVIIFCDGEVLYNDRMEFLRYANERKTDPLWFADEIIEGLFMAAMPYVPGDTYPEYSTVIMIKDTRKERGVLDDYLID